MSPRFKLALFVGVAGSLARTITAHGVGREIDALSRDLGQAAHGHVVARDVKWARSEGILSDALEGRGVLFLASATEGGPRDVWRAKVRVSPEGHPIAIEGVWNLTQTPL